MAANQTQQEVIWATGTSFASRLMAKIEDAQSDDPSAEMQKLIEACWDGLLRDFLHEFWGYHGKSGVLYLWEIREAVFFLGLELGEFHAEIEKEYSINPYVFLHTPQLSN